jgi:integral membrane sensor domain MASE1
VRLILANALAGAALGAVVGVLLLVPQGLGLGHLVATSTNPWVAGGLLIFGMMGTFGGLVAGGAIMLSGRP